MRIRSTLAALALAAAAGVATAQQSAYGQ
ncbi:hypothetical protein V493_06337, partial [Pseudogymnoascus sp. VKM F-4281 (FW-2241)]